MVLKCAITQTGTIGSKVAITTVAHTRTQYPALVLGVISGTTGTTASYIDPPNVDATSSETFSVSPTGGDGTTITYSWAKSGDTPATFTLTNPTISSATLAVTGPGLGTGTAYSTTLGCTISQTGAGIIPTAYKTVTRTHTGSYALASLACNGKTLALNRSGSNTQQGFTRGYFYIKSDGSWSFVPTYTTTVGATKSTTYDGAIVSSTGVSVASGFWHSIPATSIGTNFYVRFTASTTGYAGATSSPANGTSTGWLSLTTDQWCYNYLATTTGSIGTRETLGTYIVEIATANNGTNIKSTTTVYLNNIVTNTGTSQ